MRSFLAFILKYAAQFVLARYHPIVVAITGSVGKTSTKTAITAVLAKKFRVRTSLGNRNTEIGVPSTILGMEPAGKNAALWLGRILIACFRAALGSPYPEALVLEFGVDKPGDMQHLVSFAKPRVSVVSAMGEIPVHVEFFAGPKRLAREKEKIVAALPVDGVAVLNFDDATVLEMKDVTDAHIMTFGFGEGASVRAMNYEIRSVTVDGLEQPTGVSFKIATEGSLIPLRLKDTFGKPQVYAALAAVCVGRALKIPLLEIVEALRGYEAPQGRMRLRAGVKHTWVLDDTYNAAPASTMAALETLRALPARRRIAVLGDMLELGKYTEQAHRAVGAQTAAVADLLFTVGERARFIAQEAAVAGLREDRIKSFSESSEASKPVEQAMEEGDIVLVKGSHAMKMEKVVEEIAVQPHAS